MNARRLLLAALGCLFFALAVLPYIRAGRLFARLPPGYSVVASTEVSFPQLPLEEVYYEGKPTGRFDRPINREVFPISVNLAGRSVILTDSWMDAKGIHLSVASAGAEGTLTVIPPDKSEGVDLGGGLLLYITEAEVPGVFGDYRRSTGEYFYGFRSVVLSAVRTPSAFSIPAAPFATGCLFLLGFLVFRRRPKGGLLLMVSSIFLLVTLSFPLPSEYAWLALSVQHGATPSENTLGDNILVFGADAPHVTEYRLQCYDGAMNLRWEITTPRLPELDYITCYENCYMVSEGENAYVAIAYQDNVWLVKLTRSGGMEWYKNLKAEILSMYEDWGDWPDRRLLVLYNHKVYFAMFITTGFKSTDVYEVSPDGTVSQLGSYGYLSGATSLVSFNMDENGNLLFLYDTGLLRRPPSGYSGIWSYVTFNTRDVVWDGVRYVLVTRDYTYYLRADGSLDYYTERGGTFVVAWTETRAHTIFREYTPAVIEYLLDFLDDHACYNCFTDDYCPAPITNGGFLSDLSVAYRYGDEVRITGPPPPYQINLSKSSLWVGENQEVYFLTPSFWWPQTCEAQIVAENGEVVASKTATFTQYELRRFKFSTVGWAGGNYYARVRMVTPYRVGYWSESAWFTVQELPPVTGVVARRVNNAENIEWNLYPASVDHYEVEVYNAESHTYSVSENSILIDFTRLTSGWYYARVRAWTTFGGVSPWSEPVEFEVRLILPKVTGVTAEHADTGIMVSWDPLPYPDVVYVLAVADFYGRTVLWVENIVTTFYWFSIENFSPGEYTVLVRGETPQAVGLWSDPVTFTIEAPVLLLAGPPAPPPPVVLSVAPVISMAPWIITQLYAALGTVAGIYLLSLIFATTGAVVMVLLPRRA